MAKIYVLLIFVLLSCMSIMGCIGSGNEDTINEGDMLASVTPVSFTYFYLQDSNHGDQNYPTEIRLGEKVEVIVGIINYEGQRTSYNLQVQLKSEILEEIGPIMLDNNGKWESPITFMPKEPGDQQKAEFLLYKNGEATSSMSLHFWISVQGDEIN